MTHTVKAKLERREYTTAFVTTDGVTLVIFIVESKRIISIKYNFGASFNVDQGATLQRGRIC